MMMNAPVEPGKSISPVVSVIVPARNEERSLAACLGSLVGQTGVEFEILVVDDGSTDATRAIAQSFSGVTVVDARPLSEGWSGKFNAMFSGAQHARGRWLLFTDADTVHKPGSLARSVGEAEEHKVALLSYSPEQDVRGFWQTAVMAVIFAELASTYRPTQVCDETNPAAAANGQYLLILRARYIELAKNPEIRGSLLEDVALARALKHSGARIRFRFGGDAVRTRMYRNFAQLREGWTKNLALLFPATERLALCRLLEFLVPAIALAAAIFLALFGMVIPTMLATATAAGVYGAFLVRVRNAHFGWRGNLAAVFGLPLFSWLLLRSHRAHLHGEVVWKGRRYGIGPSSMRAAHPVAEVRQ